MRLACLVRQRQRLFMLVNSSLSTPSLKRPHSNSISQGDRKFPRSSGRDYSTALHHRTSNDSMPPPPPRASGSNKRSLARGVRPAEKNRVPLFEGPLRDINSINEQFKDVNLAGLKQVHIDEPKSTVGNVTALSNITPVYTTTAGHIMHNGAQKAIHRTRLVIPYQVPIETYGDGPDKKSAETAAAKAAFFQLHQAGSIITPPRRVAVVKKHTVTLNNGANVNYEQARNFMEFYCHRYGFGFPEVVFKDIGRGRWEACMSVGGRRIGIGMAENKKNANIEAYLDVTRYLDSCDAELWTAFEEALRTGKDLPMANPVYFHLSDRLDDEIRDLCHDIKKSKLYLNRPVAVASNPDTAIEPTPRQRPMWRAQPAMLTQKSDMLLQRRNDYLANPQLAQMRATRMALPVFTRAEQILSHIRDNDVTILMAATGSGKTTQVPQLILDEAIEKGQGSTCNIICTQPRRIAAISVAHRVTQERGETSGKSVGYQVRFEAKLPEPNGSITYCTTGVFLKKLQTGLSSHHDKNLDDVTHIVVDEVHERDIDTDLLLVVLKRLLADRKARNKPVKIILMSATIDPTSFQNYFLDDAGKPATITEIPGRSFPVTKFFLEDFVPQLAEPSTNWVFRDQSVTKYLVKEMEHDSLRLLGLAPLVAVETPKDEDLDLPYPLIALTVSHVLQKTDSGHVLVFLPGWEDIIQTQRAILSPAGSLGLDLANTSKFTIHLLHSTIPLAEQQVIFEPSPKGVRRIILATNIAETSVTIPDVVYVVDTAKIKEQRYDPDRHMSSLVSAWVGSSNLNQRAGRAGRHRSGEYFGILGRQHAENLSAHQTVEMKRVDLSNVVMHVKALDFPNMGVEEVLAATIEPPAAERVASAMKDLQMVGALDQNKSLTSLGRVLLQLPVETQMGRLVLYGCFFRCLDEALTLAAILTNRDPFITPQHLKAESAQVKHSWAPVDFRSDALATLRAYNAWWALQSKGDYYGANRFCIDNFLAKPTLLMIQKIKGQLLQSLYHAGVIDISAGGTLGDNTTKNFTVPPELNVNGSSLPLLGALIAVASQPKYAVRSSDKVYRTAQDKATFMHPSSVNNRKKDLAAEVVEADVEKQLYAFLEKRMNATSNNAQMFLVTTTRLDPMTYILFGAHKVEVTKRGMNCDGWLPIIGNVDALDDVYNLKTLMEACMLRVFEGITMGRRQRGRQYITILPREEESESGEDDSDRKDYSMSPMEIKELDLLTRDIVRILNRYSEERIASQSRQNSRPATPMGSPALGAFGALGRLPGVRSGYSTPQSSRRKF